MPIETERLLLRELLLSDADGMYEMDSTQMCIFSLEINL
jgi:hypothetical protein